MASPGGARLAEVLQQRCSLEVPMPPPLPPFLAAAAEPDPIGSPTACIMGAASSLTQPLLSPQAAAASAAEEAVPLLLEKDEPAVREEAHRLLKLAVPMMIQSVASMLLTFVSTTFVGHLNDPLALSAVVLSSSLYNVTGMSMTIGMASAMDTLCGQAFGARNYAMLGVVQQRARYICWTLAVPLATLWFFIEPVLLATGQDAELSRLAATNLRILIPGLFLGVVNDTTRRYLVAQRAVFPTSVCYIITTALSPLINWLFIFKMGLRVEGAAYALLCCIGTNTTLLTAYQVYRDGWLLAGSPQATWSGLSKRAFRGWKQYLSLGIPAATMICLEWWVWELMIFMSGLLPEGSTAVGVMGLCIQITNPSYMVPSSFGSAAAVRVSNLLGAGLPMKARLATRVASLVVLVATALLGSATFLGRHAIVRIFTEDASIRAETAMVVPAVAASIIGDGMVAVLSSVLRASGRQALGSVMNAVGYWGVCLPLAWLLGFHLELGVLGFWVAMSIGTALQAAAFAAVISRYNWPREVERAHALLLASHSSGAQPSGTH